MTDSEWVTVTEASEKLNIPVETIRRYIRSHSVHLKIKKLHKKYYIHDESMTVIRRIRALYEQGKNVDEVEETLSASGIPMTFTVENDNDEAVTVHVADELKEIKRALYEQQEFNRTLLAEFHKQSKHINKLVEVVTHDRKLFEQNREILNSIINDKHQAEIEVSAAEQQKKRGFFSKLFSK